VDHQVFFHNANQLTQALKMLLFHATNGEISLQMKITQINKKGLTVLCSVSEQFKA